MKTEQTSLTPRRSLGILLAVLAALLAVLFHLSFSPPYVLFSSDGPLGYIASQWEWARHSFDGFWQDLNWIGAEQPSASPSITMALFLLMGPVAFLKFYVPITLLILGISAWYMLRRLNLSGPVCIIGGIAAALNTHPFSFACWGLGSLVLTFASAFFAMGLVVPGNRKWWHFVLAGLWIGVGVMEGFDNGAIMSLYASAWLIFLFCAGSTNKVRAGGKGIAWVGVMAVCAGLVSTQTLLSLVKTQIQGVAGAEQDTRSKEQNWDWATQWSLPKAETLRVLIPGLYGYRMDTPEGGEYWGSVGQQPGWEQHHQGLVRHSGAGEYAGVLVVCLALLGVFAGIGGSKLLSELEHRIIYFWIAAGVLSLLLSWGRHAPFYQVVYSLPYFSTIRNPIKFMLPVQMALIVLSAYGLDYIYRKYRTAAAKVLSPKAQLADWWKRSEGYERKFVIGLALLTGASVLGYLIYGSSAREVIKHLTSSGFADPAAAAIHKFSLAEVRWTILFLLVSAPLIALALAGWFAGSRLKWLGILFGVVLATDLYRASLPWLTYYNYQDKYELNPLLATLKERPFERRVTARSHPMSGGYLVGPQGQLLPGMYNDWIQHQFQYYRIQSLDISQMPRVPQLDKAFFAAFAPKSEAELSLSRRLWELTNTRWILAQKEMVGYLNQMTDAGRNRFSILAQFNFTAKPGRTQVQSYDDLQPEVSTNGNFALIEFSGALPRAKLYNSWKVSDDAAALQELTSNEFDPASMLLVAPPGPAGPTNALTSATNKVDILAYQPRRWEIQTESSQAGVLLLNDRFEPHWSVTVDGKPEILLRCNYIMRGIQVPAGTHKVILTYKIPPGGLYLSIGALLAGVAISGFAGYRALKKS